MKNTNDLRLAATAARTRAVAARNACGRACTAAQAAGAVARMRIADAEAARTWAAYRDAQNADPAYQGGLF